MRLSSSRTERLGPTTTSRKTCACSRLSWVLLFGVLPADEAYFLDKLEWYVIGLVLFEIILSLHDRISRFLG